MLWLKNTSDMAKHIIRDLAREQCTVEESYLILDYVREQLPKGACVGFPGGIGETEIKAEPLKIDEQDLKILMEQIAAMLRRAGTKV